MTKKIIRDILIKKRPPSKKRGEPKISESNSQNLSRKNFFNKTNWTSKNKRKTEVKRIKKGKVMFVVLVCSLSIILCIKTVNIFSKTIVRLVIHKEVISIDTLLTTSRDGASDLPLETMEISATKQKIIKATGVKNVETKASGKIRIFNSFSSQTQTLIANTRFETPDGKIYRIDKTVVVPGAEIKEGTISPSSIETTVYADKPGEEYNIGPTDFTIPGFKGGVRYDKFYGRSQSNMEGGFKGEVPIINEEDFEIAKKELQKLLGDELVKQALLQTPEEFLLHKDTIEISFSNSQIQDSVPSQNDKKTEFIFEESATLFAPLFSKNKLAQILVKKYLGEEFQDTVSVANLENLSLGMLNRDTAENTAVLRIVGEVEFVWLLDEEKLKEALIASAQKNSDDVSGVFKDYPAIDSASVMFRPSWWKFFPNKTSKILVEST
ncbi:hypothetical protein KKA27_00980 [Patescibacteria group bacterium]|nr:hypothetical protein [Patescibacteria group bacterium]